MNTTVDPKTPGEQHYGLQYLGRRCSRFASYWEQIANAVEGNPATALLVGKGDGVVEHLLRRGGIAVTTLDIQSELKPDVLGSVDDIPLPDAHVDVSLCCQVLEHLEYDRFVPALSELRRVTRGRLVLSLPDQQRFYFVRWSLSRFKGQRQLTLPHFRKKPHVTNREDLDTHAWEIGYEGSGLAQVRAEIERAGWQVTSTYRVYDFPSHRFFCCE